MQAIIILDALFIQDALFHRGFAGKRSLKWLTLEKDIKFYAIASLNYQVLGFRFQV